VRIIARANDNIFTAMDGGNLGVGISQFSSLNAKLHVVSTTEQLRLGYDASNYTSLNTNSSGNLTVSPS